MPQTKGAAGKPPTRGGGVPVRSPVHDRFELEEAPARLGMRPETWNGGGWGSTMTTPKLCGGGSLCELEGKAGGS